MFYGGFVVMDEIFGHLSQTVSVRYRCQPSPRNGNTFLQIRIQLTYAQEELPLQNYRSVLYGGMDWVVAFRPMRYIGKFRGDINYEGGRLINYGYNFLEIVIFLIIIKLEIRVRSNPSPKGTI